MKIRFKRDIPNLVEDIFKDVLEIESGIIFEAPENRTGDYKIRNVWGLGSDDAAREKVAPFRNGDMTRLVSDRKQPMSADDLKREPNVYEDFDRFSRDVFVPQWILPIFHGDTALFIIYVGKQKGGVSLKFTSQLVEPLLSCSSQAIVKLSNKETRPSFSTFNK